VAVCGDVSARGIADRISGGDTWLARALARHVERNGYVDEASLAEDARVVFDWKAGLPERDPGFARRMRVDFAGALEHAKAWHETLARKAARVGDRAVDDDPFNTPVALAFADGWKWVWLKTTLARMQEGKVMGHCVGGGAYERLPKIKGVFGLRDPSGVPRVTIFLDRCDILHEAAKGNAPVPARYAGYVEEVAGVVGARLLLGMDPATPLVDGPLEFESYGHVGTAWIDGGRLHRDDGPALVYTAKGRSWLSDLVHGRPRSKEWWRKGRRHRDGEPAIELENGDRQWWVNGRRHRDGEPAIVKANGDRQWWRDGRLHREGAPAAMQTNGDVRWYLNGKLHRDDGPAIEDSSGHREWVREGKRHRDDGPALVRQNGDQEWWIDGARHREDGPAVLNVDGREEWWWRRRRHRVGGPSITYPNGDTEWHRFGMLDREDGPAIDRLGTRTWFRNGLRHREHGPAVENKNGVREWWFKGRKHRTGAPAVEYPDGSCEWWDDGVRHRDDGPAMVNADGSGSWWREGRRVESRRV
jgi:hypothetical protein